MNFKDLVVFFETSQNDLTSNVSVMNQRISKFFFANPILFRRCAGSVLQNAMNKIAHNQTRDPDSLLDI